MSVQPKAAEDEEAQRRLLDYQLPPALIAQHPCQPRGASRLLMLRSGQLQDGRFADVARLLAAGDVLVMNHSRVMQARLFGRRDSGGQVEVLIERLLPDGVALAQIRASHPLPPGTHIALSKKVSLQVRARQEFYHLTIANGTHGPSWSEVLQQLGRLPLPPYIHRVADARDQRRYQTLYSDRLGSVAAPTAGLHFTKPLLLRLTRQGVILAPLYLHVGAGTFQPVRDPATHLMHAEHYELPPQTIAAIHKARSAGRRIIAVGTTTVRALETAAAQGWSAHSGEAHLFIRPGFRFRVVDALITNFHQPHTSLLLLVAALAGVGAIERAYAHAIAARYRFLSYGDAMYVDRHDF